MNRIAAAALLALLAAPALAQDIRGMENCGAEKQMERRTGCLQANVEFLQQELAKLKRETQAQIATIGREAASAKAEAAALKAALTKLETEMTQMKTKAAEPAAKK